ncbi:MAG: nitroreductase family protein [Thermoplasmata archaeon]|nr:nitroreductase family protein [Thermoplasmata archaeon]
MAIRNEAIRLRKSTRSFSDRQVSDDDLDGILEAGMRSPSSKNRQPWRVFVLEGDLRVSAIASMRGRIESDLESSDDESKRKDWKSALVTMDAMEEAPILLAIVYEDRFPVPPEPYIGGMTVRQMVDVLSIGAFIENMVLEAQERGIATLWVGDFLYAVEELKLESGIEGDIVSLLAIGYPEKQTPPSSGRKDGLVTRLRSPQQLPREDHSEVEHRQEADNPFGEAQIQLAGAVGYDVVEEERCHGKHQTPEEPIVLQKRGMHIQEAEDRGECQHGEDHPQQYERRPHPVASKGIGKDVEDALAHRVLLVLDVFLLLRDEGIVGHRIQAVVLQDRPGDLQALDRVALDHLIEESLIIDPVPWQGDIDGPFDDHAVEYDPPAVFFGFWELHALNEDRVGEIQLVIYPGSTQIQEHRETTAVEVYALEMAAYAGVGEAVVREGAGGVIAARDLGDVEQQAIVDLKAGAIGAIDPETVHHAVIQYQVIDIAVEADGGDV